MRLIGIALFVGALVWLSVCPAESSGQVVVDFDDGSRITTGDLHITADWCKLLRPELILDFKGGRELYTAERHKLVSIALHKPVSSEEWDKLRTAANDTDRIVVNREGHLDFYAGTVPEITSGKVFFRPVSSESTPKTYELNREKIVGVIFARKTKSSSATTGVSSTADRYTGEILHLTNGDILYSVLEPAKGTNDRLPWRLANGMTGLVPIDKIKRRQSRLNNIVPLASIEPGNVLAVPLGLITPAIITNSSDWKNTGIYRKRSRTEVELVPPCLVTWPIPPEAIRVEGEFRLACDRPSGTESSELQITLRVSEKVVFRMTLDARQGQVPFSIPLTDGTSLECQIEFPRGPWSGGLIVLSGNVITAVLQKSR